MSSSVTQRIYQDRAEVASLLGLWREGEETIVFTNGVFDLIHPGHVLYLEQAAALGTKLVLGLNSDVSAKALGKGDHRPINDQRARALVMAGLRSIDMVVFFDEATPLELIQIVRPDILVKGGDYTIDQIVGAPEVLAYGGSVQQLDFAEGYSTTAIEQKILKAGLDK
ncbi:MAG: D-glycero-beta-D-manno-heptose 1-phosphate adenylyltransferase [Flavobacteriales bacterium]|nr:D-glycero-beta-D-manno-heptose 1-phosphate adenylyltransferase [Flavobacteriales bacterium]